MDRPSANVVTELAPKGKLRAAINLANNLLTKKDPMTGEPGGIAVDLARELARRLGVPADIVEYPSPGVLADAVSSDAWDVGFIGAEPQRAKEISFTAAYVEIECTYLVPPDSPLRSIDDVDREGVRIAVLGRAAYELYLSRNLKHAKLEPGSNFETTFERFVAEKLDAQAGLRSQLEEDAVKLPGSRLLEGRFTAVQQAIGTPKAREAGARYLREFVEDIKASGLVARTIEKNGIRGLSVAAAAAI